MLTTTTMPKRNYYRYENCQYNIIEKYLFWLVSSYLTGEGCDKELLQLLTPKDPFFLKKTLLWGNGDLKAIPHYHQYFLIY